jgi:bile acid:Na+ symporter, BASS family
MTIMIWFNITVVIFTVANLMAGGLECDLKEALKWLRSPKLLVSSLIWGWVVGPALAWLIILVLPLSEGHAAGLMLTSLAPIAPFLPLAAMKARGDMTFTGAYILLGTVVTVVLMPVMAPLLIKGLTLSVWPLAKPLILLVLIPLLIGIALRAYKPSVAIKIFPWVKKTGGIFLLLCLGTTLWIYGKEMLSTIGSFAPGAWVVFMIVMAVVPYLIGFGLKQNQRSVMAIGQSSRNISAGFVAFFGITNPPDGMFLMVLLVVPLHVIIGLLALPPVFANLADKTGPESSGMNLAHDAAADSKENRL